MIEAKNSPKKTAALGILTVGAAAMAFVLLANRHEADDAGSLFISQYTDNGGCLNDTPYDPDKGATVLESSSSEQDILTIIPEHAGLYSSKLLTFMVVKDAAHGLRLQAAGSGTASVLAGTCGPHSGV